MFFFHFASKSKHCAGGSTNISRHLHAYPQPRRGPTTLDGFQSGPIYQSPPVTNHHQSLPSQQTHQRFTNRTPPVLDSLPLPAILSKNCHSQLWRCARRTGSPPKMPAPACSNHPLTVSPPHPPPPHTVLLILDSHPDKCSRLLRPLLLASLPRSASIAPICFPKHAAAMP